MAKVRILVASCGLVLLCWAAATFTPALGAEGQLTEVQRLKAELVKTKLQLATKEQELAACTIQVLTNAVPGMEQEFLKQMQAEPGATWNWATMSPSKPPEKK